MDDRRVKERGKRWKKQQDYLWWWMKNLLLFLFIWDVQISLLITLGFVFLSLIGYYCPEGQVTPTPGDYLCPTGHYCPENSPVPTRCEDGYYQDDIGTDECNLCEPGKGRTKQFLGSHLLHKQIFLHTIAICARPPNLWSQKSMNHEGLKFNCLGWNWYYLLFLRWQ